MGIWTSKITKHLGKIMIRQRAPENALNGCFKIKFFSNQGWINTAVLHHNAKQFLQLNLSHKLHLSPLSYTHGPSGFTFINVVVRISKKKQKAMFYTETNETMTGHATQSKRWKTAHRVASVQQRYRASLELTLPSSDFLCAFRVQTVAS